MGNCETMFRKLASSHASNGVLGGHSSPISINSTTRNFVGTPVTANHRDAEQGIIVMEPGLEYTLALANNLQHAGPINSFYSSSPSVNTQPRESTAGDDSVLRGRPPLRYTFSSSNTVMPTSMAITSTRALEISKRIDEELNNEHRAMEKVIKLLLLGPSESGKSTVLKQMRIIHLNGFTMEELWSRRPMIFLNTVQSMAQILQGLKRFGVKLSLERDIDANIILTTQNDPCLVHGIPEKVYFALKRLWADKKVQYIYERRSEFYLMDCAKYFLDELDRIYESEYVPTITDILHSRMETIGVTEIRYNYKSMEFRIFDVGGQKTERRKWIHIFDNVNSIFFIVAISEYDQQMREDLKTNRMHDAIELFRNIGNNVLLSKVQIILFLNKKDIFAHKILCVPLTACFPNYRYKNDYKNAAIYITKKFEQQIRDKQKMIYTHLCCATDTDAIQFVTNSVTDMIIAENFKQTGIF